MYLLQAEGRTGLTDTCLEQAYITTKQPSSIQNTASHQTT